MAVNLGTITINGILLINCDSNPSLNVGLVAPKGSISFASDGSGLYYKSGLSNTSWDLLYGSGSNNLAQVLSNNGVVRLRRTKVIENSYINYYGDSFTQSYMASTPYKGYVEILTETLQCISNNYSESGKGVYAASIQCYQNISFGNINPTFFLCGFNDLRRGGSNVKTLEKIKSCTRALVCNSFLKSFVPANDASVIKSGTWTTFLNASSKNSGNCIESNVLGSTLTYVFSGNNLVIGTFSDDNVVTTSGDFSYSIDGQSPVIYSGKNKTDGISDGSNNNSFVPNSIFLSNLGSGNHTIVITATEAAYSRIDYFGILNSPQKCYPIILSSIPKMNSTGYSIAPNSGSDSVFQLGTNSLNDIVDEFFNYPIFFNEVNDYYDVLTGLSSDNIHPNDTGYSQIASSYLSLIETGIY